MDRPVSTDELQAYVDDRLDPDRRLEVEQYLDAQPALARQVAAWSAQRAGLRDALAAPASEPIPPGLNLNLLLEAQLARRRHSWWRVAAAVVVCLGLGGAGGWYFGTVRGPSRIDLAVSLLQQQALASYAVYAVDGRHPIEVPADQSDHLSQWLSNRLKRSVAPPDLSSLGYRLLGGRLVATERGGAAALFVYDDSQGNRLSVLLRPMAPELRAARSDVAQGSLTGCSWIAGGMGYAVVGTAPDRTLDGVADQISRQLGQTG